MNADFFFHVSARKPPSMPLGSLLGEVLSTREKVFVKVKVVDTDAGRLDGRRVAPAGLSFTSGLGVRPRLMNDEDALLG